MTERIYLKEVLQTPEVAKQVREALDVLSRHGVFSYLRATADTTMALGLGNRNDVNNIVLTAGDHLGYTRALDNVEGILQYVGTTERLASSKSTYGVKTGDIS